MKVAFSSLLILLILIICDFIFADDPHLQELIYKRYNYRKKPKFEKKIKQLKQQCESSQLCQDKYGLDLQSCVRRCMSPDCYNDLYAADELEEGEIDVRYNSFKGCIIEKKE